MSNNDAFNYICTTINVSVIAFWVGHTVATLRNEK
jgi:hypothetical protein